MGRQSLKKEQNTAFFYFDLSSSLCFNYYYYYFRWGNLTLLLILISTLRFCSSQGLTCFCFLRITNCYQKELYDSDIMQQSS